MRELLHRGLGHIRAEGCLFADPVSAFPRDRSLGELVSKLDFEVGTIQTALAALFRDEELSALLVHRIGHLCRNERGSREDELKVLQLGKFCLQRFESVDRKARRRDSQSRSSVYCRFEVIA
jgi:hypothetical protein